MHHVPRGDTRILQRHVFPEVDAMTTRFWIFFAAIGALSAQQVVAPTPEPVGPARGGNRGEYNITNSFELGDRWSCVGGDVGEYRTHGDYDNGVRLLCSILSVNSKCRPGPSFNQIL